MNRVFRRAGLQHLAPVFLSGMALVAMAQSSSADPIRRRIIPILPNSGDQTGISTIPPGLDILTPPPAPPTPPPTGMVPVAPIALPNSMGAIARGRLQHQRLILTAEGSHTFNYAPVDRPATHEVPRDGEIWLALTTEDGQPFTKAQVGDVRIRVLSSNHTPGTQPMLNIDRSSAAIGFWNIALPGLRPGNHFYLLDVTVIDQAGGTMYEGETVVRAIQTTELIQTGQRPNGTMWYTPTG